MSQLTLYCKRSEDIVETFVVYTEYTSKSGLVHLLAYVGGRLGAVAWRSERILVERAPNQNIAKVTEYGDWEAGGSYVRAAGEPGYRPKQANIIGHFDASVERDLYTLVEHWVYYDEGVLKIRMANVGSEFNGRIAELGGVDLDRLTELREIWTLSGPLGAGQR
jgi:hypothetical protein